jgi:hypothetical protein
MLICVNNVVDLQFWLRFFLNWTGVNMFETNYLPGTITRDAKFKCRNNCNNSLFVQDDCCKTLLMKLQIISTFSWGSLASSLSVFKIIPRYSMQVNGPIVLCAALGTFENHHHQGHSSLLPLKCALFCRDIGHCFVWNGSHSIISTLYFLLDAVAALRLLII